MAAAELNLLDTRGVAKPQTFDGSEAAWPAWTFVFESYCLLLSKDLAMHMDKACDLEEDPTSMRWRTRRWSSRWFCTRSW